jgi:hypothetical protein
MTHDEKTLAMKLLQPLGGWSITGGVITIHEDGKAHGYTIPTEEQLQNAHAIQEQREPLLSELNDLDQKLRRDVEELADAQGITLSPYLQEVKARKEEIRNALQSL